MMPEDPDFGVVRNVSCHRVQIPCMEQDKSGAYKARVVDGAPDVKPLQLQSLPLGLTLGVYQGTLVCDLTSFEEARMESAITIVVDETGALRGGDPLAPPLLPDAAFLDGDRSCCGMRTAVLGNRSCCGMHTAVLGT
jgi:hypothetical protein